MGIHHIYQAQPPPGKGIFHFFLQARTRIREDDVLEEIQIFVREFNNSISAVCGENSANSISTVVIFRPPLINRGGALVHDPFSHTRTTTMQMHHHIRPSDLHCNGG